MEISHLLEDWVEWWHPMGYMWIQAAWGHRVGNSKCLQVLHLSSRPTSEFIIALMDSSLLPQTQLQPHCLSFQANTTLLSPASKNHLPKPPASKSILWLCLLGKLTGTSVSLPPPHFLCTIIAAAAAFLPPPWSCCQECPPPLLSLPIFPSPKASYRRPAALLSLKGLCSGYQTTTN